MPDASERAAVNRLLQQNGLGKLDDPGLIPQIGFLVGAATSTHEEFRTLINKCVPAERVSMYEAVKPYLRFQPKPLDVYVAELGQIAEQKQLPLVTPEGGLAPFKVPEIAMLREETKAQAELEHARKLIADTSARAHLQLVCLRCTREESFPGWNKQAAVTVARIAGWVFDPVNDAEICPSCSKN